MSAFDMSCPSCDLKLESLQLKRGSCWSCSNCGGKAINLTLLKKLSEPKKVQAFWMGAYKSGKTAQRNCPSCKRPMKEHHAGPDLGSIEIDICTTCQFLWFDAQELDHVPRASEKEIENRESEEQPRRQPVNTGNIFNDPGQDDMLYDLFNVWWD